MTSQITDYIFEYRPIELTHSVTEVRSNEDKFLQLSTNMRMPKLVSFEQRLTFIDFKLEQWFEIAWKWNRKMSKPDIVKTKR